MPTEFELIARHFTRPRPHSQAAGTVLGVGDDAALIRPQPGEEIAISTDMLVAGTHFLPDTDPQDLGWKTLAVNVSDLAAMGATPRWALLAASLPSADEAWVAAFAKGFFECAEKFELDVIGGDTTRGPLTLCPTVLGTAPAGSALRRSGAKPGDDIWVSGQPGLPALGLGLELAHLQAGIKLNPEGQAMCLAALHRPQPRVALGRTLREGQLATAAIDVSDGLMADLGHVLQASMCAATLRADWLPLAALINAGATASQALTSFTSGGDDYELLFTASPDKRTAIEALSTTLGLTLTRIGHCETAETQKYCATLLDAQDQPIPLTRTGYDHFR